MLLQHSRRAARIDDARRAGAPPRPGPRPLGPGGDRRGAAARRPRAHRPPPGRPVRAPGRDRGGPRRRAGRGRRRTGARSPRSTGSCCASGRARSWRSTTPSRSRGGGAGGGPGAARHRIGGALAALSPVPHRPRRAPAARRPPREAAAAYRRALELVGTEPERAFLAGAIARAGARVGPREVVAPDRALGRALAAANSGITVADATREGFPLMFVNDAFLRMTGYARGGGARTQLPLPPGARRRIPRRSRRSRRRCASGARPPWCCENYRKDGSGLLQRAAARARARRGRGLRPGHRRPERRLRARPRASARCGARRG